MASGCRLKGSRFSLRSGAGQDARTNIAQAIDNGEAALGDQRSATAPSIAEVPAAEAATFDACRDAAAEARRHRAQGYDPTNGSQNFNLRNRPSDRPFFGLPAQTINGPFNNTFPAGPLGRSVYINTYGQIR